MLICLVVGQFETKLLELTELRQVLENTQGFFSEQEVINLDSVRTGSGQLNADEVQQNQQNRGRLGFVAGVIQRERIFAFERMLWRISRGNVFLRRSDLSEPLKDPATGHPIYKTVFVAFFQGEQLKNRIKKVCTGFHASLYPCPSSHNEREEMVKGVHTRLQDLKMVLNQTEDHRRRVLLNVSKELAKCSIMVSKMKAIYHTLNLFNMDVTKKCLIGLYTIITFPFLFAVMFGDLGHGLILFLFGVWMVTNEKKLGAKKSDNEIWNIFFGGRYIIMFMGLFSMYTGFIYNDVFSKSMNIFGSKWKNMYNESTVEHNENLQLDPKTDAFGAYEMGLDPIWQLGSNKIIFLNGVKMKLSIILGVLHMIFGVCMSIFNFVHFKRSASIVLEFLPQILFLCLLFGYMVFMMFFKFVAYSADATSQPQTAGCAPSILIMFINMMLFKSVTIHTIEYVLSTISHTASYLRLWALSLAHAQLSEVLWNMVLQLGLKSTTYTGSIGLFIIFSFWAALTLAILVMMEGLSAFLHTLRLHWVEFMSKFYEGLGYPFQPFSFKLILEGEQSSD
uniref:V-type proton ATPase subunit a n=2 Tax=Megaselia scalaris TaxID=36166 RepID=T1GSH5_MEGSC